jgi:hypothetical protein
MILTMKTIAWLIVLFLLSIPAFCQQEVNSPTGSDDVLQQSQNSPSQLPADFLSTRGQTSEWWEFTKSLAPLIANEKYIYSLLFPDTLQSIFEGTTPGTYTLSRARDHSVGVVFSPRSDIMEENGYAHMALKQPYNVDTIAFQYNYNRYAAGNDADTLIIDIFKPTKLFYYTNSATPRGCSMGYDLPNNKGRNYTQEVKIKLTNADTITYKWRGKGWIYIPLSSFGITANTYGNPVGFTVTFKPAKPYSISDTLNGDFNPSLPHSTINNFYFWNFTDYSKYEVEEWNNGVFVYSFTGTTRYKYETTNGNMYYRGKDFANRTPYPVAKFKITYDPDWIGIYENQQEAGFEMFPNPVFDKLNFVIDKNTNGRIEITVTNVQGQIISSNNISNPAGQVNSIDVGILQPGIYLLRVKTNEGSFVRKFMKE